MKENIEVKDSPNITKYVGTIKENIKRRFSHYKISKLRENYRDGLVFEEQAEYKKAIRNYLICLEMDPSFLKCMKRLANLYSSLEENSNSLEMFFKITQKFPSEISFFDLGQEFFKQNRLKKAIHFLNQSLHYNKRYINSHVLLYSIYARVDNIDKTEQYLSNALKIDPNHKTSLEGLTKFYHQQHRYRDSLDILNRYLEIYEDNFELKLLRVDLLTKTENYAKALGLLSQITSTDERFYAFMKDMQSRKLNPSEKETAFIERITSIKNKKLVTFEGNLQNYNKNSELNVLNPKDAFDLSILYLFIGNNKKALKYLLFSLQLNEEKKYN